MIIERLRDILHKVSPDYDISQVTEASNLRQDLGMDSLAMMLVSMEVEDAFGLHFSEPVDFKTVGDVVVYLKGHGIED